MLIVLIHAAIAMCSVKFTAASPKFFTSGDNCKNLIVKPGGSGGGGGGGGGGGDAGGEAEKEEEKKEEEEEEEIDMAGGMDMFGGEGGGDDY